MDFSEKWSNLPKGPSLQNLTEGGFGVLKEAQHGAVQDLTKAHIESFDQAVTDGLSRVVQVTVTFCSVINHIPHHCSDMCENYVLTERFVKLKNLSKYMLAFCTQEQMILAVFANMCLE